jgi:hypothetical protein
MMNRLLLAALIALTACGGGEDDDNDTDLSLSEPVSEENFREQFAEQFCEKYGRCSPGSPCVVTEVVAGNDTGEDCAFSQTSADACLDAPWPCVGPEEAPYLDIPLLCEEVWDCS